MHRIFRVKAYEAEHGPHFNEEHARKVEFFTIRCRWY